MADTLPARLSIVGKRLMDIVSEQELTLDEAFTLFASLAMTYKTIIELECDGVPDKGEMN